MPKFFLPNDSILADAIPETISIVGSDAYHLARVLRVKLGEHIAACDMRRRLFEGNIIDIKDDKVIFKVESVTQDQTEPSVNVVLYQALIKGDKFDTVVQKAVECGVNSIVPFSCERCVVRYDASNIEKKRERWQKIAAEAAKQCGRGIIPMIGPLCDFNTALSDMRTSDFPFMCYEGSEVIPIKELLKSKRAFSYAFMIGPEGGFSQSEFQNAASFMPLCGLGKRILRTETASGVVLSAIMYETDNL